MSVDALCANLKQARTAKQDYFPCTLITLFTEQLDHNLMFHQLPSPSLSSMRWGRGGLILPQKRL